MNRFINKDITTDLIRGANAMLNCMPEDKERSDKDNVREELSNAHALPINGVNIGNNNQVSAEELKVNLQNNMDNDESINCAK